MSVASWTAIKDALQAWFVAGSGLATERVVFAGQNLVRPSGDSAWIALRFTAIEAIANDWSVATDNPLVFADKTATLNGTTDRASITTHGLATGDGPFRFTTTGTLPTELTAIDVWVIRIDANTLQFATTFLRALVPTPIDFMGAGSGTIKLTTVAASVTNGAELTNYARGNRRVTLTATCFPPRQCADATEAHAILLDCCAVTGLPSRSDALEAAGIGLSDFGPVTALDGLLDSTRFEPRATMPVVFFTTSETSETGGIIETVNVTGDLVFTVQA